MNISRLLTATALASAAFAFPQVACAQETPAANASEDDSSSDVVIVTGSRIPTPNFDTPVPVTSVTAQQIEAVGQVSLGDTLNRLPALRSTRSQANSTNGIGTAGLNELDLRGLGTPRTLVLVNGRRHVSGNPGSYSVDVNTIPNALLQRIDTVTGGNSAVYGADAVSGVVNFVLREDYEGLDFRAQGGVSERGDRGSVLVSGLWGKNFAEGRGNIAVSAEYAYSDRLLFNDRNDQTGAYTGVPGFYQVERTTFLNPDGSARNEGPEGNGVPDTRYFNAYPGNTFGIISLGGTVITTCPGATATNAARRAANCTGETSPTGGLLNHNYMFLSDGTLARDNPAMDFRSVGGGLFGGRSATGVEGAMLLPGLDRLNLNLLARYEFSPAFKPYFEGKYVRVTASQTSTQPTFVNGRLTPGFFLDNPFLTAQARDTIRTVMGYAPGTANYDTGGFTFFRFNNDIGTRSEDHKRETYRFVLGARGDLSDTGNWSYDAFVNFGRTETYYETGGNVDIQKFNRAANAVRNSAGQIVCRVNADAITTNDDPSCRPLNLFGEGAPQTTPDGLAYVLYTSSRNEWHEQLNAAFTISGDTSGFLNLPGGAIGMAFGAEYRREDYFSSYDAFTRGEYAPGQSNTFLNAIAPSDPDAVSVYEGFAEVRIPLLKDMAFFHDLTLNASGRVSKYNIYDDPQWTWSAGGTWAPIPDVSFRVNWARAIRTPNLADLYAGTSQTFANNFVDPCSQTVINQNPNRVRNCAAAGIPTTIIVGTLADGSPDVRPWTNAPTSGILGVNGGNPFLKPERADSFTVGTILKPRFLPGFQLSFDYYNIRIKDAINFVTPQTIVNSCYDDPVGINNEFCSFVNRRRDPTNPIADYTFAGQQGRRFAGYPDFNVGIVGNGFVNAPFNYAKLATSGIDANLSYRHVFNENTRLNLSTIVSWLETRNQFTFLSDPNRYTRVKSVLGDPEWRAQVNALFEAKTFDFSVTAQYIGKQTVGAWNVQNREQDRPPTNADAFPFVYYPEVVIADVQLGIKVQDNFRFYIGVDNITDQLPPYGLTGTGTGSAIFPVTGRYFYGGVRIKM
jgi:outer membrane receptor protein involved in Fe transport